VVPEVEYPSDGDSESPSARRRRGRRGEEEEGRRRRISEERNRHVASCGS
jgi:hypothetical protein